MTCDETRDLLSAYLDEGVDPDERSRVDAHLEGCAECRRELEALRGTVALLHRVEPVQAPVGFVDRVMVAARPRPWYRRVADAVLLPLSVKLPLEATAVVMIGLLAVYLFERSPELQQAAREVDRRQGAAAPAPAREKPAELLADKAARGTAPSAPAPVEGPPADARARADAPSSRDVDPPVAPPSPPAVAVPPPPAAPTPRYASPPPAASSPSAGSPAPPAAVPEAKPPAKTEAVPSENVAGAVRPESEIRQRALQTAEDSRAAGASARLGAKKAAPPADVVARVAVKDRDAAERELAALVARLGGAVTQRRREEEATVVEAVIPQARYAEFSESLTRIGSWRVEAERPDLPAQIRVVLRLQ